MALRCFWCYVVDSYSATSASFLGVLVGNNWIVGQIALFA